MMPSPWMAGYAHLVRAGSRLLDVAAGGGRHARFFAARGARVLAVDRDAAAFSALSVVAGIETRVVDLETGTWPFAGERFDAIVVANYLYRPSLPHLIGTVADDGVLLYETFARGNEAFGRPSNPDFLLEDGELLDVVRGRLTVVAFSQGRVTAEGRTAVVQRIAAIGRARPWPPLLRSEE